MLLVCTDVLLANGDGLNLILLQLALLFAFFLISFLAFTEINIFRLTQSMILHFSLQLFPKSENGIRNCTGSATVWESKERFCGAKDTFHKTLLSARCTYIYFS